jgi:hypothetical protein
LGIFILREVGDSNFEGDLGIVIFRGFGDSDFEGI